MAQEPSSRELLEAVKQQESGGRRYKADGKTLLEGLPTKYGTAKGEMQVLDMTNRDPGFGVRPAKDGSPDERARVGRDYLAAMTKRYGDTETGLIAYNWGPGNTDKWIKKGADPAKLPKETQNYVTKVMASLGGPDVSRETYAAKKTAPKTAPKTTPKPVVVAAAKPGVAGTTTKKPAPAAPKAAPVAAAPVTVASMDSRLADLGPSYQAALALSFLADTDEKEDRDIDREPGVAEKYLAEMDAAPRPAALSEFIDVKIRSPFTVPAAPGLYEAEQPEQPVGMADGGEANKKEGRTEDSEVNDKSDITEKEIRTAQAIFPELPVTQAVYLLRGGERQNTFQGEMLSGNIGARIPLGKDAQVMLMLEGSRPEGRQDSSKALLAALNQRMGDGNVGARLVRPVDAPVGFYAGNMSASYPLGRGQISGNINAMRTPDGHARVTDYGVGYGGQVGPGNLSAGISRQANSGLYSGQVEYRLPIGRANGSPETGERMTPQHIEQLAADEVEDRVEDPQMMANKTTELQGYTTTRPNGTNELWGPDVPVSRSAKELKAYTEAMNPAVKTFTGGLGMGTRGYIYPDQPDIINLNTALSPGEREITTLHELDHSMDARGGDIYGRPTFAKMGGMDNNHRAYSLMGDRWDSIEATVENMVENREKLEKFFGRPLDNSYFRKDSYDTLKKAGKTKAMFSEQLASLSALEQTTGKFLTQDPEMRDLFPNAKMMAVFDALTGPRQTRMDARDLPPHTPVPSYNYVQNPVMRGLTRALTGPDEYGTPYRPFPIKRANGSPETGEVGYFQDPFGVPDSGPVTADTLSKGKEFNAADALRALKETGTGVARNVKNIAKGTTETPYNLVGSVADIGNMALTPLGLGSAEPTFGSAHLKRLATEAGIRLAPPTDLRDAGFYMMGELGSSVLNPAGVVRSGVKATGKAAKMLEDMTVGNIQRGQVRRAGAQAENIPDTAYDPLRQRMEASGNLAYAVRNKGTPYTIGLGSIKGPDGNYLALMDDAQKYVKEEVAITGDSKLNDWLSDKVTSYLRRDFATPDDQFVKAAENNQLLHFVNKPIPKRPDLDPYYDRISVHKSIENLPYVRETEGFNPLGEAVGPYAKRVETLTDASASPAQIQDVSTKNIPLGMRDMVETNPTARLTELGPNINKMLKLDDLALSMEKMRSMPKTYSAYSQPAIKVPEEYLFTDKALEGLTPAQASNRVATFRNWEQENRQRMASKFMKEDPRLDREELSGKFTAVALPDLQKFPELKQLAMDVGCDGNWCTKKQADALGYGSGENRLHIILDEKARPLAQITLSDLSPATKRLGSDFFVDKKYSITELLGKDNSKDFSKNPALPAIQQYVKSLDNKYGLGYVTNLKEIKIKELDSLDIIRGATQLSKSRQRYKPGITQEEYQAASAPDLVDITAKVRELNGGSRYITLDQDTKGLVQQALEILAPQQRAKGGMVQGYANGGIADLPKGYSKDDPTTLKPFLPTTTGIATLVPNAGNPNAAANQAAAFAKLTPAQLAQHQVQLAMISDAKPTVVQVMFAIKDAVQNAINNSTATSSGGVSGDSGSPMGGIASKGTVAQAIAANNAIAAAIANSTNGGTGSGTGSVGGNAGTGNGGTTSGQGTGIGSGATSGAGLANGGMIERQFTDNRRYM